jgi:hypothetical protein
MGRVLGAAELVTGLADGVEDLPGTAGLEGWTVPA